MGASPSTKGVKGGRAVDLVADTGMGVVSFFRVVFSNTDLGGRRHVPKCATFFFFFFDCEKASVGGKIDFATNFFFRAWSTLKGFFFQQLAKFLHPNDFDAKRDYWIIRIGRGDGVYVRRRSFKQQVAMMWASLNQWQLWHCWYREALALS